MRTGALRWIAIVIVILVTVWSSAAPPQAHAQSARVAVVSGYIDIVDDENWPETDERARVIVAPSAAPIVAQVPSSALFSGEWCVGDEVRVTLDLQAG
jgi:hypothetical protein